MNAMSVSLATDQLISDIDRCRRAGIPYLPRFLRVSAATLGGMGVVAAPLISYAVFEKTNPFLAYVSLFFALLAAIGMSVLLVVWGRADKKRIDALIAAREAQAVPLLSRRRKLTAAHA